MLSAVEPALSPKLPCDSVDKLSTDRSERCRPRKILDYAVLAKGKGYRNSPGESFANNHNEMNFSSSSNSESKKTRLGKYQSDEHISTSTDTRRCRTGRQTVISKKGSRSQRSSFPPSAKKEKNMSNETKLRKSFCGSKGNVSKKDVKDAKNIKQAFHISRKVLEAHNQQISEFQIPSNWIRDSKNRKKVTPDDEMKFKTADEVQTSSTSTSKNTSVEDLAMERLVRAFKTAKLLYPEKFSKYFPDFKHCFEDENKEESSSRSYVTAKEKQSKSVKCEDDSETTSRKSTVSRKEDSSKKTQSKSCKTSREAKKGDLDRSSMEEKSLKDGAKQKMSVSTAGISGLRKRCKATTDLSSNRSTLVKCQESGNANSINRNSDIKGANEVSVPKRRRISKNSSLDANGHETVIQNKSEDGTTESSSDESSNLRLSKRQRAQSGFYK
ncbi:unnamed protein product [Thelazia callipaeda]|uniref:Bromo domain-containing protein n=1 Tax=Thelazia callipaeda TaxID=103827 RepID=A0A0N5D0V3_THECL|nr:unnamed protein product [Thelazia callipaeda]